MIVIADDLFLAVSSQTYCDLLKYYLSLAVFLIGKLAIIVKNGHIAPASAIERFNPILSKDAFYADTLV